MITRVTLPKVNTNIEEETVTKWLKKEGDRVQKKEPLVELTTEKASFDFESPASGVLRKVLADEKSVLPVGYVIALIGGEDDELPDVSGVNRKLLEKHRGAPARAKAAAPVKVSRDAVRATPAARRLAKEKGLDLAAVAAEMKVDVVRENVIEEYLRKQKPGS